MSDYIMGDELPTEMTPGHAGVITDDRYAEFVMDRLRTLNENEAYWKGWYKDSLAKTLANIATEREWRMEQLRRYYETLPHYTTKSQEYYTLPSGKIGVKTVAPGYARNDVDLLPWVKENHAELVQVSESVNWAELKKRLSIADGLVVDTETGEVVPGVTATDGGMKFFVQLKKGDSDDE